MRFFICLLLAATAAISAAGSKPPKWLDKTLAGYAVAFSDKHQMVGVHDKGRKAFLVRTVDCDGAHIGVLLTRDRNLVTEMGHKVPHFKGKYEGYSDMKENALPSLATSKGIALGDTPAQLTAKLGKPSTIKKSGNRKQFTDYVYKWRNLVKGEGEEWENRFTFKEGKLIEIEFRRDMVPGCGA
jgi:hypothetical protein